MPISVRCPACEKKLKVNDDLAGKRVKCPGCRGVILIPHHASNQNVPTLSQPKDHKEPRTGWPIALKVGSWLGIAIGLTLFAVTFRANEDLGGSVQIPTAGRFIAALCMGPAGFLFAGVLFSWDFFLRKDQRVRSLQGKVGQTGAKLVYLLLGLLLVAISLALQLTSLIIYGWPQD